MKARKLFPTLVILLLLAVGSLIFWISNRPATKTAASATGGKPAVAAILPPVTNAEPIPGLPFLSATGTEPASVIGTGPVTAVLAQPGSDPAASAQQPPAQTTTMSPALRRIRPARLTDLASLRSDRHEVGVTANDRRFQFDLFPGLSLTATAHTLEVLEPSQGETTRGVYTGTVDNVPGSIFTLAYNDDAISASIVAGPYGRYVIQPAPDGWYRVSETNPNNPDFCGSSSLDTKAAMAAHGDATAAAGYFNDKHVSDEVPTGPGSAPAQQTVTVLVVFSDDLRFDYGGANQVKAVIDSQTAFANQSYVNSKIGLKLQIVGRDEVTYTETGSLSIDLDSITDFDGIIDSVHARRDALNADLVSFWVLENAAGGLIGLAWLPQSANADYLGFSCVRPEYDAITFPHELGHNFGCDHNIEDSGGGGRFPFSYGYRVEVNNVLYMDIMSYMPTTDEDYTYIQAFSNPNLTIFNGVPFGAAGIDGTDNALTHNLTAPEVAAFRPRAAVSPLVGPPSGVSATDGVYPVTIVVQWSTVPNANGYQVFRSETNSTNGAVMIGVADPGELAFEDNSPSPAKVYYYFIKTLDLNNNTSAFSQGDAGSTRPPALGTLSSISASDGTDTLYIRVNFSGVANADHYNIYRSTSPIFSNSTVFQKAYQGEYLDYTAEAGITYYYWVEGWRGEDEVSTLAGPDAGHLKAPPVPGQTKNVTAYVSPPSIIHLHWNATADAARYEIVRTESSSLAPGFGTLLYTTPYAGVYDLDDTTPVPGTTYYYYVRAVNGAGAGGYSTKVSAMIPSAGVLAAPHNVAASDGSDTDRIRITWDAVGGVGATGTGYNLYRNTVNDTATATQLASLNYSVREYNDFGTGLTDNKLQPDTTYYYWVRSRNAQGVKGDFSDVDTGYIKNPPPATPTSVVASNGLYLDYVKITWNATYAANKFQIFRDQNAGNVNTKIGEVGKGVLVFFDTTALPGVKYYYRVRAVNSQNTAGNFSNVDDGYRQDPTTVGPPLSPKNLDATDTLTGQIRITWSGGVNASQYRLFRNSFNATGGTQITTTEGTSYVDKDVEPSTIYYYSVVADSAGGSSAFSNVDSGFAVLPSQADLTLDLDDTDLPVASPVGTLIGTFKTTPVNPASRTFTYTFINTSDPADDDNSLFTIVGDELHSNFTPTLAEFNAHDNKAIAIRSTADDDHFVYVENTFTIVIVAAGSRTSSLVVNPTTGDLLLAWPNLAGTYFQVQKNPNLSETGWENYGNITTQRSMTISTASGGPSCYYRVVKVNPVP